jgi:hypothetical protein
LQPYQPPALPTAQTYRTKASFYPLLCYPTSTQLITRYDEEEIKMSIMDHNTRYKRLYFFQGLLELICRLDEFTNHLNVEIYCKSATTAHDAKALVQAENKFRYLAQPLFLVEAGVSRWLIGGPSIRLKLGDQKKN